MRSDYPETPLRDTIEWDQSVKHRPTMVTRRQWQTQQKTKQSPRGHWCHKNWKWENMTAIVVGKWQQHQLHGRNMCDWGDTGVTVTPPPVTVVLMRLGWLCLGPTRKPQPTTIHTVTITITGTTTTNRHDQPRRWIEIFLLLLWLLFFIFIVLLFLLLLWFEGA